MSRHHLFNPEGMAPPRGFSYGCVSDRGRLLHIAGLTGHAADGSIVSDLVGQFHTACESVAAVIRDAGGEPSDLVSMMIYTTEIGAYRTSLAELGAAYRDVFARHYPPMALIGINELFDPEAKVELVCIAVLPA